MKTSKHNAGNNLGLGKRCLFDYYQIRDHQGHLQRLSHIHGLVLPTNPPPKTFDHLVHGTRHLPTKCLKHDTQEVSRENLVLIRKMNLIV